jgi:hypothetical protein
MGVAKKIDRLSSEPVEYFDPVAAGWPMPPLHAECGLVTIRDDMDTDSRMPNSPARWRRFHQWHERGTWTDEQLGNELEGLSA